MKRKSFFIHFQVLAYEKIIKENGKTKLVMECLGKYKNSIKDAISKYKKEFGTFENEINYSSFYNDVKNSKYIKLEDCLEVVYTKIIGKPIEEYNNEVKTNSSNNTPTNEETVKNFINDIFNWALNK